MMLFSGIALAQARKYSFDIRASPLASALTAFGTASHQQITFSRKMVAGRRVAALRGSYTPEEALERLLNGSGLSVTRTPSGVFVIQPAPSRPLQTVAVPAQQAAPAPKATPPPAPEVPPAIAPPSRLEEIVVTALRQVDTVNRAPLSIAAQTGRSLALQGVTSALDLGRITPSLSVTAATAGVGNFTIRGIYAASGAPTTGVYLDDTSLTKRATLGTASTQNAGTPTPPIFDLERVEILRGPQGTLYGGSTEGGAIRYITPTPSLTRYSAYARSEVSHVHRGGTNREGGLAIGGPIVADKLGFRAAIYDRHYAGWIDAVDPFQGGTLRHRDINSQTRKSVRVAFLWRPTERLALDLSYFGAKQTGSLSAPIVIGPKAITLVLPEVCFNGSTTAVPCATPGAYHRPGATIPPFTYLDGHQTFLREPNPQQSILDVAALTADYDFGFATLRAITSFIHDKTRSQQHSDSTPNNYVSTANFPFAAKFNLFPYLPDWSGGAGSVFNQWNKRHGWSEELRLASKADGRTFGWLVGGYYSWNTAQVGRQSYADLNHMTQILFGLPVSKVYRGVDADGNPAAMTTLPNNVAFQVYQWLGDEELAAFGEGNYRVADKIKLIAGVRASQNRNHYSTIGWGPINGYIIPTEANGGYVPFTQSRETAVTPKFGAEYEFDSRNMVYATASKGFRPGGVNSPVPQAICGPGLANTGLTIQDIPLSYGADSVWSYEVGAKLRVTDDIQLNTSLYHIDWSDVQLSVTLPSCSQTFVTNAATARSQGFDIQAQARLFHGLTANLSVAYTDARYTADAFGPQPANKAFKPTLIVQKNDTLPVAPWTANLSAQYDFPLGASIGGYARFDLQYANNYLRSFRAGVSSYAPDSRTAEQNTTLNLRAGLTRGGLDLNVFATNVLNAMNELERGGGRAACRVIGDASCRTFGSYAPQTAAYAPPRQIGVQASYRY